MNCPFCQEKIKNSVFAESDHFYAIYNIAPIVPGHSLIIPKTHITSLLILSANELSEMMNFAKEVTQIVLKAFNSDSFNWSVQDNDAAGQTVSHLHLHIVPRHLGDLKEAGDWYPLIRENDKEMLDSKQRARLSQEQMDQIVSKLKEISGNEKSTRGNL
jgi:bis(5'-adenosyl)-triphosphatase